MMTRNGRGATRVIVRRDHIAGGVFVAAGILILLISNDLPFGTLASPGAGMLPTIVIVLMMLFGAILFLGARESPPLAGISWPDLPHATKVVGALALAATFYTTLGFILTMALLLFSLIFLVERRGLWPALALSIPIPLATYYLFDRLLSTPLNRGLLWF